MTKLSKTEFKAYHLTENQFDMVTFLLQHGFFDTHLEENEVISDELSQVYEWYGVTYLLARELRKLGELVIDYQGNNYFWGVCDLAALSTIRIAYENITKNKDVA